LPRTTNWPFYFELTSVIRLLSRRHYKARNKGSNISQLNLYCKTSPIEECFPLPDFLSVCTELWGQCQWQFNRQRSIPSLKGSRKCSCQRHTVEIELSAENPQIMEILHAAVDSPPWLWLCAVGFIPTVTHVSKGRVLYLFYWRTWMSKERGLRRFSVQSRLLMRLQHC
jgi:hypothetical protein